MALDARFRGHDNRKSTDLVREVPIGTLAPGR